jgi:hypothetical protein
MTTQPYPWKAGLVWLWRMCPCREAVLTDSQARVRELEASHAQQQADDLLKASGMAGVAHLTLASFDPRRYPEDQNPYEMASRWLARALEYGATADYHDPASPPAALWFYAPGKGRGKTHLAAALAWEARREHRLTALIEEESYLSQVWSCPFEVREALLALPGSRAWLTVVDDIGQRERASSSVADAWYAVINRRYTRRGWTIITSNKTIDELEAMGTINDATRSRLNQMTRGGGVFFDCADQRRI